MLQRSPEQMGNLFLFAEMQRLIPSTRVRAEYVALWHVFVLRGSVLEALTLHRSPPPPAAAVAVEQPADAPAVTSGNTRMPHSSVGVVAVLMRDRSSRPGLRI